MDSTRRFPGGTPSLAAALPRRDLVLISTCIVHVTALAWVYLVHLDRQMSASMAEDKMMAEMGMTQMGMAEMGKTMDMPWTAADGLLTFAMWVVMMIGMMAGTAAPVLLLFAAGHTRRGERGASLAVLLFGLGFLAVWTRFSALATLAQWALHRAAILSPAMAAPSPKIAGVVLLSARASP